MIRLLIDENLSPYFATGLNLLQFPLENEIEIIPLQLVFAKGTEDEVWIPAWATANDIFLTQDLRISTSKRQEPLFNQSSLGGFFLDTPKTFKYWDKVQVVVRHWRDMVEIMQTRHKPFSYLITPRTLSKMR